MRGCRLLAQYNKGEGETGCVQTKGMYEDNIPGSPVAVRYRGLGWSPIDVIAVKASAVAIRSLAEDNPSPLPLFQLGTPKTEVNKTV